jgi:hypothetical protein
MDVSILCGGSNQDLSIPRKPVLPLVRKTELFCVTLNVWVTMIIKNGKFQPGVVARTCSPSTWEVKAGGLRVWDWPGLYREFKATLSYIVILKNKTNKTKQNAQFTWVYWCAICSPSTQEARPEDSLSPVVWDQPEQDSRTLSLKKKQINKQTNKDTNIMAEGTGSSCSTLA